MDNAELAALQARAWNWGRWARGDCNRGVSGCGSAERYYVAPRPDEEAQAARNDGRVDVEDAEQFEAAVCALRCEIDRKLLKWVYVRGLTRSELARKLRLDQMLVEPFHLRVLGAVAYRLSEGRRSFAAHGLHNTIGGCINAATT